MRLPSFPVPNRETRFWLGRTAGFFALYWCWLRAGQVIALTLMTYYSASGAQDPAASQSKLQEIGDLYASAELIIAGVSTALFVIAWRAFFPLTSIHSFKQVIGIGRLRSAFVPGLLRGIAVAAAFTGAMLVTGYYRLGGFFVQLDEPWIASLGLVVKAAALAAMIYGEEFLFRRRLLDLLQQRLSKSTAIVLCAGSYCLVKYLQFNLGVMQTLTLVLVSTILSIQAAYRRDFSFGAGLWCGCLAVFHLLFGLPVLGITQTGLFLVRYTGPVLDLSFADRITRLLTGGAGGPLSSIALQLLLAAQLAAAIAQRARRVRRFRLEETARGRAG